MILLQVVVSEKDLLKRRLDMSIEQFFEGEEGIANHIKRYAIIVLAAFIMAFNVSNVARVGGILPGGVTGVTLLVQKVAKTFFDFKIPYSAIYIPLNAIPIYIGFKYIGKKFTTNSLIMIVLTSFFVDIIPNFHIMSDILLCAVFLHSFNRQTYLYH